MGAWGLSLSAVGQAPPAAGSTNCGLPLSGQVLDHETRQPLPGTTVLLLPIAAVAVPGVPASAPAEPAPVASTATDAFGNYHFHDLCAGAYRVRLLFVGYSTETTDVRLLKPTVFNAQLHPDAVRLGAATVRGARVAAPTTTAATSLSGKALDATRGQTLGEALTRVAGVTAIQTGPSIYKPMIHGLHSNRVTLLNNGVRQEGQQWGQEHGPEIDPFVASRLTVVKGAAAVRYGSDAIGGVVLVDPAPLRDSAGVGGSVTLVGTTNSRLGAVSATLDANPARLPALRGRVQGTVRRAGTTRTPDYYLKNSGFAELDFSAALGWQRERWGTEAYFSRYHTRLGILSVSHVGNLTDLATAFAADRPLETGAFSYDVGRPYQQIQHDLLKTTTWWHPQTVGKVTLTVAHQTDVRDEYDKYRPRNNTLADLNRPELSYQNRTTTADLTLDHRAIFRGAVSGTLGLSGTYQDNTFSGRYFIPFYTNTVGGAFLIERWTHGKLTLEGGARLDWRDLEVRRAQGTTAAYTVARTTFRYLTPAANVGALFDPTPHLTLRLSASLNQRAPAPNERYSQGVHNGQYEEGHDISLAPGEAPLRPETARGLHLTGTFHHNPRLNGELTAYLTQIGDYIYATPIMPAVLTIRGPFPSYRYLQTDARYLGLDATGTYALGPRWEVGAQAALVRARDTRADDYLIFTPADRVEIRLRHELTRAGASNAGRHLLTPYVQVSGRGVARQTRVPADYATVDYKAAPAGYALLGAEAGATLRWGHFPPLDLSVTGANLLDHRYRDYLNRFRYFADEAGRNVTVRLTVRY